MQLFSNRTDAGRQLALRLGRYADEHPIVLALPRGGVPVAAEIAHALHAPLDIWIVRKIGSPAQSELGIGAVAEGGYVHHDADLIARLRLSPEVVAAATEEKRREVEERIRVLHGDQPSSRLPSPALRDRTVIVVDDGIATGGTLHAALRSIRAQQPRRIVLAVPVGPPEVFEMFAGEADDVVCLITPSDLYAIGMWYQEFGQVSDEAVLRLLDRGRQEHVAFPASHTGGER